MTNQEKLAKVLAIKNLRLEPLAWNSQDTGKCIITDAQSTFYGIASPRYSPIAHHQVLAQTMEFLPNGKVENVLAEGKNLSRVVFNIRLPKTYDLRGEGVETWINLRNSLDGSWTIGLVVSPLNVVCKNMFVLLNKRAYINVSRRHTRLGVSRFMREDVKLVEDVYNALEGQLEVATKLSKMPCTTEKGKAFLEDLVKRGTIGARLAETATEHLYAPQFKNEEPSSFLGVFNAVTNVLSRNLEDKETVSAFEKLMPVGEAFTELVYA